MVEYSVLIIDDDVWMQRILSKTLQSYGFKKVILAANGFDGIGLAVENTPDLIICDILMPELSGHLSLRILKSIKLTKGIPVLMVSALSDIENLTIAVKSGSAGFISKPFTRSTVYEKLVAVFGKDKLEAIAKGEAFEGSMEGSEDDEEFDFEAHIKGGFEAETKKPSDAQSTAAAPEKTIQQYNEAEKKSIESIKKMLLRGKK
ncbi:MAG: response regulator receiver protein [Ignavibacteria bacterium]|nr:response regulator receiver protein [Ignavibacteria bacterium]